MTGQDVTTELDGNVLVMRLARPESMNAIGPTTLASIAECLLTADENDDVHVVVTLADGPGWCAGADLTMLQSLETSGPDTMFHLNAGSGAREQVVDRMGPGRHALTMWDFPKPWIAAVNGAAAGGGVGLCLLHDFAFAARSAVFTTAFTRIGVAVDMGLSFTLPRAIGPQAAADLLYTSRVVDATEALELGLVRAVVDDDALVEHTMAYAHKLARRPPIGVQATKLALRRFDRERLVQHLEFEWPTQIEAFRSPDVQARIRAMLSGGQ